MKIIENKLKFRNKDKKCIHNDLIPKTAKERNKKTSREFVECTEQ